MSTQLDLALAAETQLGLAVATTLNQHLTSSKGYYRKAHLSQWSLFAQAVLHTVLA